MTPGQRALAIEYLNSTADTSMATQLLRAAMKELDDTSLTLGVLHEATRNLIEVDDTVQRAVSVGREIPDHAAANWDQAFDTFRTAFAVISPDLAKDRLSGKIYERLKMRLDAPSAMEALDALKDANPGRRVVVVFESVDDGDMIWNAKVTRPERSVLGDSDERTVAELSFIEAVVALQKQGKIPL